MRESSILLITICSNQKIQGGAEYNQGILSIAKILPDRAPKLYEKRSKALDLLLSGSLNRDGLPLNEMQFNARLMRGPEFGAISSKSTLYLPAAHRYMGSFFTSVKKNNESILTNTEHHVLIISALYGALIPEELIQVYSCHIEDHPEFRSIWTKDDFLTSLIVSYMKINAINKVFDLTSQDAYRELIDWERLAAKADVLHVFGEQYAGPVLLSTLGELARDHILMQDENEIKAWNEGKTLYLERDRIVFTKKSYPPKGFPKEQQRITKDILAEPELQPPGKGPELETGKDGMEVLDHARDIKITSRGHSTIFEKPVNNINDVPLEIKRAFQEISRCPDVLEIFLDKRYMGGPSSSIFRLRLFPPQQGTGYIHGKIEGSGDVCHSQDISVRVTKGRENYIYLLLQKLLKVGI